MSTRRLQRIVCFHSDVDFRVTTHLEVRPDVMHEVCERRVRERPQYFERLTAIADQDLFIKQRVDVLGVVLPTLVRGSQKKRMTNEWLGRLSK